MYAGETENRNLRTLQRHDADGAGDGDGKFSAISFVVFCYFHYCILSIYGDFIRQKVDVVRPS